MNKTLLRILFLTFGILTLWQALMARAVYDFDGDGKTDPTVWRVNQSNSQLTWFVLRSRDGFLASQWGAVSPSIEVEDKPVPEDYDGDGKWDVAIWRRQVQQEGQSYFYILYSGSNTFQAVPWGLRFDNVIPQDYDGDGKADIAVSRFTAQGNLWFILQSRDGYIVEQFGAGIPVAGDYDGDGKADLAVASRAPGRGDYTWYIRRSSDRTWKVERFGYEQADFITPGDYDGDGKTDIAVYRRGSGSCGMPNTSCFHINGSASGVTDIQWGNNADSLPR